MPRVKISDNQHFEHGLRKFKRAVEKAGIQTEVRERKRYVKPSAKRKRERDSAVKRFKKKLYKEREAMERERTRH